MPASTRTLSVPSLLRYHWRAPERFQRPNSLGKTRVRIVSNESPSLASGGPTLHWAYLNGKTWFES